MNIKEQIGRMRTKLREHRGKIVVSVIGGVILLAFLASIILFYAGSRQVTWVRSITRYLPYPIVIINTTHWITEPELSANMDSVKQFYQNQDFSSLGLRVDFSTDEGKKRLNVREREVLNKMIEDRAFEQIAHKNGITVTEDEVKDNIKQKVEQYGTSDQVVQSLNKLYGWSLKDFADKIVTPALYQQKLQDLYNQQVDTAPLKARIGEAEKALAGGENFSDVAKRYSEGSTSDTGGELGWFQKSDLIPDLQSAVDNGSVGKVSPIIESPLGFHIILIEDTKKEDGATLYRLRQIFVKKTTFSDWLTEQMQGLSIHVWSPQYRWNHDQAEVEFRDQNLQSFEQQLYQNKDQDALFVE